MAEEIFEETIIEITEIPAEEEIIVIKPRNMEEMGLLAHFLGFHHRPVSVDKDSITLLYDPWIKERLIHKDVAFEVCKFEGDLEFYKSLHPKRHHHHHHKDAQHFFESDDAHYHHHGHHHEKQPHHHGLGKNPSHHDRNQDEFRYSYDHESNHELHKHHQQEHQTFGDYERFEQQEHSHHHPAHDDGHHHHDHRAHHDHGGTNQEVHYRHHEHIEHKTPRDGD